MGRIFYIMGKSGSGKDTIYKRLTAEMPQIRTVIPYTTRPVREGETDGREYHFVDSEYLANLQDQGNIIEVRSYNTKCGIWMYFTADDGQIDLEEADYLIIGTLESYRAMQEYFGSERIIPIYIEVEDGVRLSRALERERREPHPRYAEMCRRYLADCKDFSEENLKQAGIRKRFANLDLENCLAEISRYIRDLRV